MRIDRVLTLTVSAVQSCMKVPRVVVLMYHSISDRIEKRSHPYFDTVTAPSRFEQQMQWLSELNAEVTSLDCWNGPFIGDHLLRVIITFDDGFADFLQNAVPVLKARGYPAAVFLPTGFIDTGKELIAGVRHLRWDDINQLKENGIDIGSHSVNHRHFGTLAPNDIYDEVRVSAIHIENHTGIHVTSFSCPYAFPQEDTATVTALRESLEACGFRQAVTTRIGTVSKGDDAYALRRIPVNSHDDKKLFVAKLNASYNWLGVVQSFNRTAKNWLPKKTRHL